MLQPAPILALHYQTIQQCFLFNSIGILTTSCIKLLIRDDAMGDVVKLQTRTSRLNRDRASIGRMFCVCA